MNGQQLKNSVLQMAIQGKLVPQDSNDEPASVLLEKIRKEKEQLIKEGKIKKEKNPSRIYRASDNAPYTFLEERGKEVIDITDELPFDIPESWEWAKLDSIVTKEIKRGKSPEYNPRGQVLVFAQKCNTKQGNINLDIALRLDDALIPKYPLSEYMLNEDIIINSTGTGTLGRVGLYQTDETNRVVPDSHVTIVRPSRYINKKYIYYCVLNYQKYLESMGEGSTNQKELKPLTIQNLLIPLPPVEEQNKIVKKLDSVMIHIFKYDVAHSKVNEYNKIFPNLLKKSILQEAIQGKLVPQDPNDEPASVLLERIRAEKEKLIKQGRIKKDKNESIIFRMDNSYYEKLGKIECNLDEEIPFDLPENWVWTRLKSVCEVNGGFAFKSENYRPKGVRVIRISDFNNTGFVNAKIVRHEFDTTLEPYLLRENDILLCMTGGTVGKSLHIKSLEEPMVTNQRVATIRASNINSEFLYMVIISPLIQSLINDSKNSTNDNISMNIINDFLIPMPPVEEQIRIVNEFKNISNLINNL